MSDTLAISDTDLDAMLEAVLPCDKCQGEAHYMSRGHRCRPPGFRSFKCQQCHTKWVVSVERNISAGPAYHPLCGERVYKVSDLSEYHPI
jgi:transposase-like protein